MDPGFLSLTHSTAIASLVSIGACVALGIPIGWLVKVNDGGTLQRSWHGALQAGLLALVGGLLARGFMYLLLLSAGNAESAALALGHLFFLVPAVVDDFLALGSGRVLTTPEGVMMLATLVGAFSGMMAGIWRIYDWKGLGWLAMPLDATWGLAGQTYAVLLHLVNFAWGGHAEETGANLHRYRSGFGLKRGYAFTQGAVMSNMPQGPGAPLFNHERLHVWQNRAFGPFYSLTYLGWMLVLLIPGLIAGLTNKNASGSTVGAGNGIERLCYYNCPWEVWAYAVQNLNRGTFGPELIWSAAPVILLSLAVCGGIMAGGIGWFISTL